MAEPAKTDFSSRTEFYADRLNRYLPTLQSDQARLVFLDKQLEVFTRQYREFTETKGGYAKRDPLFGWPTAADYVETITDIQSRITALRAAGKAAA